MSHGSEHSDSLPPTGDGFAEPNGSLPPTEGTDGPDSPNATSRAIIGLMALFLVGLLVSLPGCSHGPMQVVTPEPTIKDYVPRWRQDDVLARVQEPGLDPAVMVPADARLYVRLDNLAQLRRQGARDPLVVYVWSALKGLRVDAWSRAAHHLEVGDSELFDALFGQTLAVTELEADNSDGVVILTRVSRPLLVALPEAMGLTPVASDVHELGAFTVYQSPASDEDQFYFAIGNHWLLVSKQRDDDHLRRVITSVAVHKVADAHGDAGAKSATQKRDEKVAQPSPSLGEDEAFNKIIAKLPANRRVTLYTHHVREGERHGLAVTEEAGRQVIHYVGTVPNAAYLAGVPQIQEVDFGPLPAESTISAASISVLLTASAMDQMRGKPGSTRLLDLAMFPRQYDRHIEPQLAPPVLAFLGRVDAKDLTNSAGMDAPALGLAIRMKDPRLAGLLDQLIRGLHMLAKFSELNFTAPLTDVDARMAASGEYHVADFGDTLRKRVTNPNMARMIRLPGDAGFDKVTFGRIGDWYVISSQEAYFLQCVQAYLDGSRRMASSSDFERFGFVSRPTLIASWMTQAPELSRLLHDISQYWSQQETGSSGQKRERTTRDHEPRHITQPLRWAANVIQTRHSFYLQLWRDEDPNHEGALRGELHVLQ